jgi:CRISPR system Cascade subunit CasA
MNLLIDLWLPVRRADGNLTYIAPWQITEDYDDNPVVAINTPRADFTGSLMQFCIGLLQTTLAVKNPIEWRRHLEKPPSPEKLRAQFDPVAYAFELSGDGPRFMQDFDKDLPGTEINIAALLIDAPGDNALRSNIDHFIKRNQINGLCLPCIALALFTLMTNAPSGGAGHRTSLRGGGPLTTLILFNENPANNDKPVTLWQNLWLNVLDQTTFLGDYTGPNDVNTAFPWLSPTRTSEKGQTVTPAEAHPTVVYWATPRRIRLNFQDFSVDQCDICGRHSEQLVQRYVTKNYGANYTLWEHPLSPHYRQKPDSELLPSHPQPGGFSYRHWPELIANDANPLRQAARVIGVLNTRWRKTGPLPKTRLWAFGYDMDNMKPRCWYEGQFPIFAIEPDERQAIFKGLATTLVEAANESRGHLVKCLKEAWSDRPGDLKGDFSFVDSAFWSNTETPFYELLERLSNIALESESAKIDIQDTLQNWHKALCYQALTLFQLWAESGYWEFEDPKRIAKAHNKLRSLLYGKRFKTKLLGLDQAINST